MLLIPASQNVQIGLFLYSKVVDYWIDELLRMFTLTANFSALYRRRFWSMIHDSTDQEVTKQ